MIEILKEIAFEKIKEFVDVFMKKTLITRKFKK